MEPPKTVGAYSLELSQKDPGTHTALDQMREQLSEYEENVHECIKANINNFEGDFYIVVLTKKERLMQNVLRNYFFARQSCPTPDYDQTVYKYEREGDRIFPLWVIPNAAAVNFMDKNASIVPPDKYRLLGYVKRFVDGSLLKLAKKLNREKRESNIIEK